MNPAPGGSATPAGGICTTCPHGKIEVIVWKHAVCWDTPPEGWPNAKDPGFEGVLVRLNEVVDSVTTRPDGSQEVQYHALKEQPTDSDGKVTFTDLLPFDSYTVTASRHPEYQEVTPELADAQQRAVEGNPPAQDQPSVASGSQVQLRTEVAVEVGKTSYADLVLRKKAARMNPDGSWTQGRECTRRHGPQVSPAPSGHTLASVFWEDEPALLVFRDVLWTIVLPLGIVLCALIGILGQSMVALSIAALITAFWAYIGAIIFGIGFGIPACIMAGALFAGLLVANLLLAAFHSSTQPDPIGLGILAGVWAAFGVGYGGGRRDEWRKDRFFWPFPSAPLWPLVLMAIVAAMLIGLLVAELSNQVSPGMVIVTLVGGAVFGALAGWAGFAFANEGETNGPFIATDFHLPYEGERYCLQGPRGFWSHWDVEDGGNDFSLPAGTRALCAKEGHIISLYDLSRAEPPVNSSTRPPQQCFDSLDRGQNNHIEVRHKDASTAKYVYLETDGITRLPWSRPVVDAVPEGSRSWLPPASEATANPLHVQTGHLLGKSGWPAFADLPADTPGGPRWDVFMIGLAFTAVCLAFFFIMSFTVYKDLPPAQVDILHADHCYKYATTHLPADLYSDDCYCENLSGHDVQQVSNTYSDLLFPILGMVLLFVFAMNGPNFQPYKNRMTDRVMYSLLFGLVLIFMGPGSMFFHGWFRLPLSILDGASMYFFAGFLIAYNVVRIVDGSDGLFWGLFIGSVGLGLTILVAITAADPAFESAMIMYAFVGIALIIQGVVLFTCSIHTDTAGKVYFWLGAGLIIVATGFQIASKTGGPLCTSSGAFSPTSLIQGHAIWHMLSALGIFLVYFYFRHQLPVSSCANLPRLHFAVVDKPPAGNPLDQDPRQPVPGQTPAGRSYKPVKFADPGVALYQGRPRSMRKHSSLNGSVGTPPMPPDFAEFRPQGQGQHPVLINGASGSGGGAPGAGSSAPPSGPPAAGAPSSPGAPPSVPSPVDPSAPSMPSMPGGLPASLPD